MIDKDTQVDENIPEFIYNSYKQQKIKKVRKISVPVIPTSYCFKVTTIEQPSAVHSRFASRCSSRKDLNTSALKRNSSEHQIKVPSKVSQVINLTFNTKPGQASRRILENNKPEMRLRNVRYILRY